ncbi:MAG: hypothetical protein H6667_09835 [Ardenticatenaceae bacterium]|nr:hypothetical protein [Ardenticatenaceae bacterium]
MNPYLLMVVLYLSVAVLGALESSFSSLQILPWFNGMKWLRIHLITLGALTETIFWLMPLLVAQRAKLPHPKLRWDIWLSLNGGILLLLVGIPLVDFVPIFAGGTLVFVAAVLLIGQLWGMKAVGKDTAVSSPTRKFYIAGLSYFLLGIIVGTGLWFGWAEPLHIATPLEVHIHANNWGLLSLVFAGLLIDLYPIWAKRPLANPQSINTIFWMMTAGAFGLIFGPWFAATWLLVPGLLLHLGATGWLLYNIIKPLRGDRAAWTPGMLHLVTSYFWILAPVLVAPLVLLQVPGIPGHSIEANAPQALIYGWVLQFGYALIPYFVRRVFLPQEAPKLGGSRFSLVTVHLGGISLWASIFAEGSLRGILHGSAYLLWALSLLPIVYELWQIVRSGMERAEVELATAD